MEEFDYEIYNNCVKCIKKYLKKLRETEKEVYSGNIIWGSEADSWMEEYKTKKFKKVNKTILEFLDFLKNYNQFERIANELGFNDIYDLKSYMDKTIKKTKKNFLELLKMRSEETNAQVKIKDLRLLIDCYFDKRLENFIELLESIEWEIDSDDEESNLKNLENIKEIFNIFVNLTLSPNDKLNIKLELLKHIKTYKEIEKYIEIYSDFYHQISDDANFSFICKTIFAKLDYNVLESPTNFTNIVKQKQQKILKKIKKEFGVFCSEDLENKSKDEIFQIVENLKKGY